jgi:hypothetical protein
MAAVLFKNCRIRPSTYASVATDETTCAVLALRSIVFGLEAGARF